MYKFDWSNFSRKQYEDVKEAMRSGKEILDDYVGCVRVGDLCFDFIVRPYYCDEPGELLLDYDLYVGGVDDGYGYGENEYPYTEGDGGTINIINMTYDDYRAAAEAVFTDYINSSHVSEALDLATKALLPLNIW